MIPRESTKTFTALVGAEPLYQTHTAPVQQLQFFLSKTNWDADAIVVRIVQLLQLNPLKVSDSDGILLIDDYRDCSNTDYVARQYLGRSIRLTTASSPLPRCGLSCNAIIRYSTIHTEKSGRRRQARDSLGVGKLGGRRW